MSDNYEALVDAVVKAETAGHPLHELILSLGDTPACLRAVGFPELPLVIKAKTIGKAYFDHCVALGHLKRLPEIVTSPKAIYRSDTVNDGSVVLLTIEVKGTKPIIVPVAPNRQIGRNNRFNVVTSMYAKDDPKRIQKWEDAGLLIWQA